MQQKYKKLSFNTIIFALGSFGSKLISFFLVPLYTNFLTTSEYGIADLVASISSLLLPIASLSIGEAVLFFGLKEKDNQKVVLKNGLFIILLGGIALLASCPLLQFYEPIAGYSFFVAGYTILLILHLVLQYYTKAREKNLFYSLNSIVHAVSLCGFSILFVVVLEKGVSGYLYALILAETVSVLFLSIYNNVFSIVIHTKIDFAFLKTMLLYSAPLIINSISWSIAHTTDKMMLESFISADAVGIYSVSAKIPTLVNSLTNFFIQAWTMSAILEYEKKDKRFYQNIFSIFTFVLLVSTSAILIVLKPFMEIYVGSGFVESWRFVPFLLLAAIFQNFSDFFGSIIQSTKKSVLLMITSLSSCVINVVLNLILIPLYGIQGAVIGTLASYFVVGIMRMVIGLKIMPFKAGLVRLCLCFSLLLAQSFIVVEQFNVYIICPIILLIVIAFFYREIVTIFNVLFKKKEIQNN